MVSRVRQRWSDRRARDRETAAHRGHPELRSPSHRESSRLIGVLAYQGVTTTEIDGPVAALAERMSADALFVGSSAGHVTGIEPVRTVMVDSAFDAAPSIDVLVVPGGLGWESLVADVELMRWIGRVSRTARGVMAISTGSLILAAAGRLVDRDATGHWLARDQLASLGANVTTARTAQSEDDLLVTASGATAALELVDQFADRVRWGR